MHRLPDLRFFARVMIQLITWLDKNFDRLFRELKLECSGMPDDRLADIIVDSAFQQAVI